MNQFKAKLLLCFIAVACILTVDFKVLACSVDTISKLGDLRNWNPEDGFIALDGEWEFYWNELLTYEEIGKSDNKVMVEVPASWSNYKRCVPEIDSEGYATYRLKVKTNLEPGTRLGLYLKGESAAYKVFINDSEVLSLGLVSQNRDEISVRAYPQSVFFAIPGSEFDIIIQTSSSETFRSGLTSSIYIGSVDDIQNLYDATILKYSILYGLLLVVMAFSIMMAILCRDIKYFYHLAILCISIFFAVDLTSVNLLSRYITNLNLPISRVILYSSVNCCLLFLTTYAYFQFKSHYYRSMLRLTILLTLLWELIIILIPIKLFEAIVFSKINIFELYALIISALNMVGIVKGARENFVGGMEQLLCASIFLLSALIDFSYYRGKSSVQPFPILHYSLMVILVVQMVIQAKQVRGIIVQQRSEELRFVQAQVKPHLLYSVIDSYIATSQQDSEKARAILEVFSDYLRKTFDIKKSYDYLSLREAISLLQSYINIEQIRLNNSLEVNFELPDNLDVAIPTCMLQPIVENAIVHGLSKREDGGRLDIIIKRRGRYLHFTVRDNGVGMAPEEIASALEPSGNNSLSNISKRLNSISKRAISITSQPDKGTEVSWRVRIKELKN